MRRKNGLTEGRKDGRVSFPSFRLSVAFLFFVLSCDPASTRPAFMPLPQADTLLLKGRPSQVAGEAASWLTSQGVVVERWSERDAYVETAWYDTTTKRSTRHEGDLAHLLTSVKVRCWADPGAPGQTRLTVELVYRPFYDPSQPARDREIALTEPGGARTIVDSLMGALKKRLGVPGAAVVDTFDMDSARVSPTPQPPPSPSPRSP